MLAGDDPAGEGGERESDDVGREPGAEVHTRSDGGWARVLVHGLRQLREGGGASAERGGGLCGGVGWSSAWDRAERRHVEPPSI